MTDACRFCTGACAGADLSTLLVPELQWLWQGVAAAADRRGDPAMTSGPRVQVTAPADPASRSAAIGLLTGRSPAAGQQKKLDLGTLHSLVARHGPNLTPGAVAAHAVRRRLAVRAIERRDRADGVESLRAAVNASCRSDRLLENRGEQLFEHLRRSGWVAKLVPRPEATALAQRAVAVTGAVLRIADGDRRDRRLLVPEDPHALDEGTPLAGLALALLAALDVVPVEARGEPRQAWAAAGVDCDDLMGGLTVVGIQPAGWALPPGSVVTIPPRELAGCAWPEPPEPGAWVFVTENPSVLAAAANAVLSGSTPHPVRSGTDPKLLCTMGTPSALEIAAIARLAAIGWQVAVRADFDRAGLRHVSALLMGIPAAVPWRMGSADYLAAVSARSDGAPVSSSGPVGRADWDPALAAAMAVHGVAFEEALLPDLLADLALGRPNR
jgi:uncharacterized protein (TIGR02679 family)